MASGIRVGQYLYQTICRQSRAYLLPIPDQSDIVSLHCHRRCGVSILEDRQGTASYGHAIRVTSGIVVELRHIDLKDK